MYAADAVAIMPHVGVGICQNDCQAVGLPSAWWWQHSHSHTICAYRHSTGSVGDNSPYTLHNLAVVLACFMQSHAHTSLSHNQTTTETYETCILHDKTTNDKMFGGILSVFCGKINSLHRKYGIFICFSFKFVR